MFDLDFNISKIKSDYYKNIEPYLLSEMRSFFDNSDYKSFNNPLITVYIPTYNRKKILFERALPSVLGQTYKNIEIIVIDDCSNDDTCSELKKISDPRVVIYSVPRRTYRYPKTAINHWYCGPIHAANFALSYISDTSKWIARIDDDEIWRPDHLELLLNECIKNDYEFISAGNTEIHVDGNKEILGYHAKSRYYYPDLADEDFNSPIIGCTSTWLYRSYLKVFKYNEDCWRKQHNKVNDVDLSIRMFESGVRMGHLGKCIIKSYPRDERGLIGSAAYIADEIKTCSIYN